MINLTPEDYFAFLSYGIFAVSVLPVPFLAVWLVLRRWLS